MVTGKGKKNEDKNDPPEFSRIIRVPDQTINCPNRFHVTVTDQRFKLYSPVTDTTLLECTWAELIRRIEL